MPRPLLDESAIHPAIRAKIAGWNHAIGQPYKYLEYGNYFSMWRPRSALKMWTGWPSFPIVFVKGTLVGGYSDLKALIDSGELKAMLD